MRILFDLIQCDHKTIKAETIIPDFHDKIENNNFKKKTYITL